MMLTKQALIFTGIIVSCLTWRVAALVGDACSNDGQCTAANEVCDVTGGACACALGSTNPGDGTCIPVDCGSLSVPANGGVDTSSGTTYTNVATYSCNAGYEISGAATRTCGSSGAWSDSKPSCVRKDCGTLADPANGAVDLSSGTEYQNVAVFSCNNGYSITGDQTRACLFTGLWGGSSPTCTIKDCLTLTVPLNGVVVTPSGTTYLETATYICNSGYTLNGVSTRVCESTASWSGTAPTCSINACTALTSPANGSVVTPDGTDYGQIATYTCLSGFSIQGTSKRICNADRTWSDSQPTCVPTDCGTPYTLANGDFTATQGSSFGAVAVYHCNTDYGLLGDPNVVCESSGFWSTLPICAADCGSPPSVDHGIVDTSGGTLLGTTVTYSCDPGYTLSGSATISCRTDSSWSSVPYCTLDQTAYDGLCDTTLNCVTQNATCRNDGNGATRCLCAVSGELYESSTDHCMADCGSLTAPTHGSISLPTLTVEGQVAIYSCDVGYAVSAVATRTCLSTGLWSLVAPTCEVGCPAPLPPIHGNVNISEGTSAGDEIRYSCNTGYALVGNAERICLADTTWNGGEPVCYKECPVLSDIKHGHLDLSRGNWAGSVAVYICNEDYALVGISTRVCKSTGEWTGVEPDCIFAIFPDVVLVFGALFVFLVLVDTFILVFCLYSRYCKPKPKPKKKGKEPEETGPSSEDENKYHNMFEEKQEPSLPPVQFVTSNHPRNVSYRKSRQTKMGNEAAKQHPPPRLIQAIPRKPGPKTERYPYRELRNQYGSDQNLPTSSYGQESTRVHEEDNIPTILKTDQRPPFLPLLMSNPPKSTQPHRETSDLRRETSDLRRETTIDPNLRHETTLDLKETTHELTVEDLLREDFQDAGPTAESMKRAPSPQEAKQTSLTLHTNPESEQQKVYKESDSESETPRHQGNYIMEEGSTERSTERSTKAQMSFPPVHYDPPGSLISTERSFIEEKKGKGKV